MSAQVPDLGSSLDLADLRRANVARKNRWHGEDDWTLADWSNAMCGEAGEAANVVKKIRRTETPGLWEAQKYPGDSATSSTVATMDAEDARTALLAKLADECADVLCYLDLLAATAGIDLAAAVASKFNRVSEAQGFPERIGIPTQRVTHGRHCTCSACAREDWTNLKLNCGMHGRACASRYAPLGAAGDYISLSPDAEASA